MYQEVNAMNFAAVCMQRRIPSSELPEVLGMSERVYVMNEGKMVAELDAAEATQELIMSKIVSSGAN